MKKNTTTKKPNTKVKTQGDPLPVPTCPAGFKWDAVKKECVANPG